MNNRIHSFIADTKILLPESQNTSNTSRFLAFCTALCAVAAVCGFIHLPIEPFYYGFLFINLLYLFFSGNINLNPAFLFLYIVLAINISVVDIPTFFKPGLRAGLFILMTLTTSSVIQSSTAVRFREKLFRVTIYGILFLAIGSFFCFFVGINLMSRGNASMVDFNNYSSTGGWFSGLAVHSMMLGPIAMVASLFFIVLYMEKQKKWYLILFFITTMSAVFASSRAALLGIIAAIGYSLFFGKFNSRMRKSLIWLIIGCGILTLPISDIAFKGVINKQETREKQTDNINSRQAKFDFRIAEFESAPLLGVGFCAIDVTGGDAYGIMDGRIEPGTSHLSVLSMTGLLGMMAYVFILYQAYRNARNTRTPHARFVLLCFIAMFVHAWFEGYVFSAGGFLAYLYWLIIGQCIDSPSAAKLQLYNASL